MEEVLNICFRYKDSLYLILHFTSCDVIMIYVDGLAICNYSLAYFVKPGYESLFSFAS